jgi:hypothetical protein
MPDVVGRLGDLFHRPTGLRAIRLIVDNTRVGSCFVVLRFEEQPTLFFLVFLVCAKKMPCPAELLAVKGKSKMPFGIALPSVIKGFPRTPVPHHHRTSPVLGFRDRAFE